MLKKILILQMVKQLLTKVETKDKYVRENFSLTLFEINDLTKLTLSQHI